LTRTFFATLPTGEFAGIDVWGVVLAEDFAFGHDDGEVKWMGVDGGVRPELKTLTLI
jgi:hypothetical protein